MLSLLDNLRRRSLPPGRLIAGLPGCRVWYLDDAEPADPGRAAWATSLDPAVARRMQGAGRGVFVTLSSFAPPRAPGTPGTPVALSVEIDLAAGGEGLTPAGADVDLRKELYLSRRLLPCRPLLPHWLIETRGGFQAVYRVTPAGTAPEREELVGLGRALARLLDGDEAACGLPQCVRAPGWWQLGRPDAPPFLCRLLVDRAGLVPPYGLPDLGRAALRATGW